MTTPEINQGRFASLKGDWNKGWEFYNTDVPAAVKAVGDAERKSLKTDTIKYLALFALSAFAVVYLAGIKTLFAAIVLTLASTAFLCVLASKCFNVFASLARPIDID